MKDKKTQQEIIAPFIEKYFQNKTESSPWIDSKGIIHGIVKFEDLLGYTFKEIIQREDEIVFKVNDSLWFVQQHEQDCCESVHIDDIVGDFDDLVGSKILRASEDFNTELPVKNDDEGCTWTFYNIATFNGHVTIKWYGTSNGYYSEKATLSKYVNMHTIEYELD